MHMPHYILFVLSGNLHFCCEPKKTYPRGWFKGNICFHQLNYYKRYAVNYRCNLTTALITGERIP